MDPRDKGAVEGGQRGEGLCWGWVGRQRHSSVKSPERLLWNQQGGGSCQMSSISSLFLEAERVGLLGVGVTWREVF